MMAEQKGRGGKKPRYQIADIGGSNLTPQDLSTERVLNFLIKGEASAEQGAGAAVDELNQAGSSRELTTADADPDKESAHTSLPSSPTQGKKSLDHLFRRASAGGTSAKALKLDLPAREESAPAAEAEEVRTAEQAQLTLPAAPTKAESDPTARLAVTAAPEEAITQAAPQPAPAAEPEPRPQIIEPQEITLEVATAAPEDSTELSHLIWLWKSFYRLKDGEIEALSAMYRMSHSEGSDECYVKMHKLAEMSGLTYRYCQKVVRSLEQLGWITKLKDYDPTTQIGVLYRINLKPSV